MANLGPPKPADIRQSASIMVFMVEVRLVVVSHAAC